jgi:hypothetical protein
MRLFAETEKRQETWSSYPLLDLSRCLAELGVHSRSSSILFLETRQLLKGTLARDF